MKVGYSWVGASALLVSATLMVAPFNSIAQSVRTDQVLVIRGLTVASQLPSKLNLATRYGLLQANPNGMSILVPGLEAALTSLAAHPQDPRTLLTSGYTAEDDMLGVMLSSDGGDSWSKISEGAEGPAAFYDLDFSRSDPNVVYGLFERLQVSRDGGQSWKIAGDVPQKTFSIAVSSKEADTLYAATNNGIFLSRVAGASWERGHSLHQPATMIHSSSDGRVYAFVIGVGLIAAKGPKLEWRTLSADFFDRYLIHMVDDQTDPQRLYAIADTGAIMTSDDGGQTWTSYEGSHFSTAETIAKGSDLYERHCQVCHGVGGIGESPDDPYAEDEFGFKAPAMNDDAHAWHHSDSDLMATIFKGSPRNERMVAFEEILSEDEVQSLIAYIKSLWSFRSLACQGARHMPCMGHLPANE